MDSGRAQDPHGHQLAHKDKEQAENEEDVTEANTRVLRQPIRLGRAAESQAGRVVLGHCLLGLQ